MTQITIPNTTYERLSRQAAAMRVSVDHLATAILEGAAGATTEGRSGQPADLPYDLWKAQLDELDALIGSFRDRYPPGFEADVRRESMYRGCGE